jgi:anti-anti-sigma factor
VLDDDAGRVRVTLGGELDLFSRPALAHALEHAERSGKDVVVDLSELSFMDCAGLALVRAAQQRTDAALVAPRDGAARMLLDAV